MWEAKAFAPDLIQHTETKCTVPEAQSGCDTLHLRGHGLA